MLLSYIAFALVTASAATPDLYATLEVDANAPTREVDHAFVRLKRRYPKSLALLNPRVREARRRGETAYFVLGNPARRYAYDRVVERVIRRRTTVPAYVAARDEEFLPRFEGASRAALDLVATVHPALMLAAEYEELLAFETPEQVEALELLVATLGFDVGPHLAEIAKFKDEPQVRALAVAAEHLGPAVRHHLPALRRLRTRTHAAAIDHLGRAIGADVARHLATLKRFDDLYQVTAVAHLRRALGADVVHYLGQTLAFRNLAQEEALRMVSLEMGARSGEVLDDVADIVTPEAMTALARLIAEKRFTVDALRTLARECQASLSGHEPASAVAHGA